MSNYKVHLLDIQNQLQNYIWLLEHTISRDVIVVDPTEAEPVEQYCREHGLNLSQIWLTHWHKDHIGGVPELLQSRNIPVYGPREELSKIPFITHPLQHEAHFKFHDLQVDVLAVPGHTLGHIVYFMDAIDTLFCGDTLFAMGCGRVFEGTFEQMYHSLNRLAALPARTQVYCTHEYTLSNAKFALHVEPDNLALQQRYQQVEDLRLLNQPTLPSTIELELQTNPFLRVDSVEEFQKLREMKDNF
ncbi:MULTISPECIES: hydroxyacylglutathione hydrolase [Acinetobacter]|uniref:Hydroxyacylglutathione hydrolase n=1 Tax=Acinetobacter indicus TaxID=756892 RepID=A0A7S6VMW5_9GAMM|nr:MULTISPECIES: hydroxyacylglutathione hydrolase [Acinetobacter]MDM1243621.1 hydroxyacylglutathione hydrolase [Acinetobacter indicus]MDM1268832.1 hydroxyacylglutathione hydrolase [Acinetobacter indicus]MDM1277744.1 hydroxyacylglutathione hydrolase [Acinetobacter indicus]MDM1287550.1 hydroxyacylglutathione hydrolase [Acinetobacter indicus]MDO4578534.1 hydroxyacylglutathione hydrolase [Acinetobacter sp.]